ncbi:MAG TPA: DUF1365 domain-containing protein [Solirubrobacteraceae bacterium]|nr:DUF1365 domain-containing protein [Solirubrobacteraceae bacterium]
MSPIASCIYEGTIRHRRSHPRREFQHRLALFYLDLDELPSLLGGRLVAARPGLLRFRRRDYLGPDGVPLDQAVRDLVQARAGVRPPGPVRLLTQLRSFGHCFNPVSFYYCLDRTGERPEAVVAEVTNTPWRERHAYVLSGGEAEFDKALHVSPFMGMDHRYAARAGTPGERLALHIESRRDGKLAFDATLALRRRELTGTSAARLVLRYPAANVRVLALIYGHAIGLKLAGAQVHRHPPGGAA